MFGGIGFMVQGKMACGVIGEDLVVRLGKAAAENALKERGVRPFDFTGRPMTGWVFVGPEVLSDDADLARWIDAGVSLVLSLGDED